MANDRFVTEEIVLNDAHVWFQDWAGASKFTRIPGVGTLLVSLPPDLVEPLKNDGWLVKLNRDADPNDLTQYYIPVAVSFKFEDSDNPSLRRLSPKITMIVGNSFKKKITSKNISELDEAPVKERIDIRIRPHNWTNSQGDHGVKAYLATAFVTVPDNRFGSEYDNIPYADEELKSDNGPQLNVESDELPF